jgi:hypothetical protein
MAFDLQPLERSFGDLLDVLGPAIEAVPGLPVGIKLKPNLVAITTLSRKRRQRVAQQRLIRITARKPPPYRRT